jgi:hypothetical protein
MHVTVGIFLVLFGTLPTLACAKKTSSWWFQTHTPEYTTQAVDIVTKHKASITGAYYYHGFHIATNGSFMSPPDSDIETKAVPFLNLGLTVGVALGLDQDALQNNVAHIGIKAAAATAARNNLSSLMIDYEPRTNITAAHAKAYAAFVQALAAELHVHGLSLGMCVSSWSILTEFSLYAKTGVDNMMSMASTYYGKNIAGNEEWMSKELAAGVSLSQLHVGIGSTNSITQKWDYEWTEAGFKSFMGWLQSRKIQNIDIWRTDIDTLNATDGTAQWIYDGVAEFLASP